jgi:glycerophosphoryl diester phosphodiesterase
MRRPELIAHRGYRRYPENTLPAFVAAIKAGARFVECDIQLTADLAPVLFHDASLVRLCSQDGAIHDYPLKNLRQFRVANVGRFGGTFGDGLIPTLEEFLALLKKHPLVIAFVELKNCSLERFGRQKVVGGVIEKLQGLDEQVVIISYDPLALAEARRQGWQQVGAVIDRWQECGRSAITGLKPNFLFCDVNGLPGKGEISFAGARIAVFEVADPAVALQLAARGVDLVETFVVKEMLEALNPAKKPS